MSIPDEIREIRKRRHMMTTPDASLTRPPNVSTRPIEQTELKTLPIAPLVASVDVQHVSSMEDETLEEVLARIANYEKNERLAMDTMSDDVRMSDASQLRPPKADVVECLFDPSPRAQRFLPTPALLPAITSASRITPTYWQCGYCSSINLVASGAFCLFCNRQR
jgi:hypothetical protein